MIVYQQVLPEFPLDECLCDIIFESPDFFFNKNFKLVQSLICQFWIDPCVNRLVVKPCMCSGMRATVGSQSMVHDAQF